MIDRSVKLSDLKRNSEMDLEDADSEGYSESSEQELELKVTQQKRKITDDDSSNKSKFKKGKLEKGLYKPPTVEELNQLRETENLFHSNLFRLQIEEILNAVKIKKKYKKLFDTWFEQFKESLENAKATKELQLNDDSLFKKFNIKIPIQELPNDCAGTIKCTAPTSVTIGGSYSIDTIIGPDTSIDVLVEMPESLFSKIDSKNYRYIRKKAIYLAYITSKISDELVESKTFVGTHWNPVLKIVPKGKLNKHFVIYVHLAVQETAFSVNKFTPEKNNVKPNWFFNDNSKNKDINPPTPYYNSIVQRDLTALKTNIQNAKLIKEYPNIRDGIILLKIWLRQREFCNNFESFNGHIITMYVLYLLATKKLNTFMSSYQIVRNTWQFLSKCDWCKEGISLCQEGKIDEQIVEFHKYYECVFLDFSGVCNIASNIFQHTFKWISSQAESSFECLNNTRVNSFQILFMHVVPFYKSFDLIVCLHNQVHLENIVDTNCDDDDKLNYGPNKYVKTVKYISKLLEQGLGNRVTLFTTLTRKIKEWQISDDIPEDLERIYFGFQLNPDFCFNIIEKGPAANLPEAAAFRNFWGGKSELRRFKDGTICEAVVWTKESAKISVKRQIPQRIIKYLIESKLNLFEKTHYFFFSNQVEKFLRLFKVKVKDFDYGTEEAALKAINAFDSLEKELSGLTDVPLSINGVQGCSPLFRYAEVFPPISFKRTADEANTVAGNTHLLFNNNQVTEVPIHLAPIEATLQLTTSGKWPDDLEALRMTKAAFYCQIAECMRKQYKSAAHGSKNHIDIMKDGLVFRLRIAQQKEIGLVKQVKEDGVTKYRDNEESITLEENLFFLPRITGALYGIHCQQPSFGAACCLAKRWLSAQLIDDSHIPDLVVELLMASMYLNSEPYKPAQEPQVAFLRFLESFAREHWSTDPIIVNFNNEMSREEIVEVENLFGTSRETLPALFISTPYDKNTSTWTRKAPSLLILNRISALSKEALKLLDKQLLEEPHVAFDPLFKPVLSEYDCLIKLKNSLNSRRCEAIGMDENTQKIQMLPHKDHPKQKIPVVGFNPVDEYLKELRTAYNEYALFFHDTYGGNLIGVVLQPKALQEKDFKVPQTNCHKLDGNKKLILNVSAMIEDFYILGKGLVETIDIQSNKIKIL